VAQRRDPREADTVPRLRDDDLGASRAPDDDTLKPGSRVDLLIGSTVGGFKVESALGRGAAGIVYQARQLSTGRKAAFKVLKPELAGEPEYIRRFIEEAKALSALRHPGIVDILDFGALPSGQPYLAMELCDGVPLEEQLKLVGKPTLRETLGLIDELLAALGAAHDRGIIHRDVKPSNLFLATNDDGTKSLKVLDFGLARLSDRRAIRPTMPGAIIGTPDYMAPEQILGKEVGTPADVYAVGGIAFRLLTDRLPFLGETGIAVLTQKMDLPPPHPRDVDASVPAELDTLVHELLAGEPARRPSLREARARFEAYAKSLDRGPTPQLVDDEDSLRPTAFHAFGELPASRRREVKTQIGIVPPSLSPPSRRTELEHKLVLPPTDLEGAHAPAPKSSSWPLRLGIAAGAGAVAAAAWWLTHR
jgi:serine/threonine protein kinase